MSGILSVRDRIAMMNTSKPAPKPSPESASSFENSVRKAGSIAEKIAALKAAGEKQESDKHSSNKLEDVPAGSSMANEDSVDIANSDARVSEDSVQPAERRLSIKDRIAAIRGGHSPVVSAAPSPRPVAKPVSMPISKSALESLSPSKDINSKIEKKEIDADSSQQTASSDDLKPTALPKTPEPSRTVSPSSAGSAESAQEPPASTATVPLSDISSISSISPPTPVIAIMEIAPPEVAEALLPPSVQKQVGTTSSGALISSPPESTTESLGPKVSSIAAKIAALKHQQHKPIEHVPPPPSDNKERRRLSTDVKSLGAKINLGGLLPGAPRPILPPRPSPVAGEESGAAFASSNKGSSSGVDENGELKHVRGFHRYMNF